MARRGINKTRVVAVVISAMVVVSGGAIGLMFLWGRRDPSIYVQHALEAVRAGQMADAIRAYGRAYRETLDPEWVLASGLVAKEFGDATRALNLFDKAIAARSDYLPAHRNRVALRLELVQLDPSAERYANLRKDSDALLVLSPEDPQALLARSVALAGLVAEDPAYAEQSFETIEQAHKLAPEDVAIVEALAGWYERKEADAAPKSSDGRGAESRAEALYRDLIRDLSDSAEAHLGYAGLLIRRLERRRAQAASRGVPLEPRDVKRELAEIRDLLDKATKIDPRSGGAALAWATYWPLAGSPDKAIDVLGRAIQATPNDLGLYVALASRMLESGQPGEARKVVQQGLDRPFDPESYRGLLDRPRRHRLWCMKAESYLAEAEPGSPRLADWVGRAEEARRQAEIELSPNHWRGRLLLGRILRTQGRPLPSLNGYLAADQLLDWQQNATEKLALKLELAEVQLSLREYASAQETLAEILEQRPTQPTALAFRAGVNLQLGRSLNALSDAKQALEGLGPPAAAASRPAGSGDSQRADMRRQALRVLWVAGRLENQIGDADQAERALSPVTASDRVFLADACRQYGQAGRSEPLLAVAEKAYLAAIRADPTQVEAVRGLAGLYAARGRGSEVLPIVRGALKALADKGAGSDAQAADTARCRLAAMSAALDPNVSAGSRDERIVAALSKVSDPIRRAELLADYYLASDRASKAVAVLSEAAASRPDDVHLLERRFVAALAAGDWRTAGEIRQRAVALDADGISGRLFEGRLELARGRRYLVEAREKRESDSAGAHDAESLASDRLNQALVLLRDAADEARGLSEARVWLGDALLALGRDEAVDAYRMALLLGPLNADAHRQLARLGKLDPTAGVEADEHLAAAIRLSDRRLDGSLTDAWLRGQAADIYERNHPAESIQRRQVLHEANPNDAENLLKLGELHRRAGQQAEADKCLRQALAAAPNDRDLHRRVAELYREGKRYDEATAVLTDLVSRSKGPDEPAAWLDLARHLQGVFVEKRADGASVSELREVRDQADRAFKQAAEPGTTPSVLVEAADFCLVTQRRAEAVKWLRRSLRIQQPELDERPIREKLIRVLLSMRPLPDEIEKEIGAYDARFQGYEEVSLFWGVLQAARGEWDKAIDQHSRYVERLLAAKASAYLKPGQLAEAYYLRGKLYLRLASMRPDRSDEYRLLATDDLNRAKSYAPPSSARQEYAIALAGAFEVAGKGDQALRELRTVVRDHPDASRPARELIDMLGRQGKWAEQESAIRRQMQRKPNEWLWPNLLARAVMRRRAVAESEQAYKQAAELCGYGRDGVGREAVFGLLQSMLKRGAHEQIIDVVAKHVEPSARGYRIWATYGAALARAKRLREAAGAWKAACNAVVTSQELSGISTMMQVALGRDGALRMAQQMHDGAPGDLHTTALLAVILDQTGRRDRAIKMMEQARPAATQPAEKTAVLSYLGTLKLLSDRPEEGAELYRKTLEIDKDHLIALNNLAAVLADRLDKPEEALGYARRAAELMPNSVGVLDTLGWCLVRTGDESGAIAVLEEAYGRKPTVPVCYHLAETYRRMGKTDRARQVAEHGSATARKTRDKTYQTKLRDLLGKLKSGK